MINPTPAALEALKPCPFCGGKEIHDDEYIRDGRKVFCSGCGASTYAFSPDANKKAIKAWNTRPVLQSHAEAAGPIGWAREWEGDDSDLGNFIIEIGEDKPDDDNPNWFPLYTSPQPQEQSAGDALERLRVQVLYNPYNGKKRDPRDVKSDPFGQLIIAPGQLLKAALQPSAQQKQNNFKVGVESDTKRNGEILDTPQSSDLACKMLSDHQPSAQPEKCETCGSNIVRECFCTTSPEEAQPEKVDVSKFYISRCDCEGNNAPCLQCAEDTGYNSAIDYLRDNDHLKLRGE